MALKPHPPPVLPDKLYFKIGEVSNLAGIPTYVLRFWESEFKQISPRRTQSGQRQYKKSDVELILKIKHLLYDRKFTIQGAKRHLLAATKAPQSESPAEAFAEICSELKQIKKLLAKPL
ncbi:MAG: MerR family transcriptional regulator [Desulfobacterales bacterium]|nr:MerR family transcriptional regulator [Desulfobacterales bacterium]